MSDPAGPVSKGGPDRTMDHLDEITCLMYAERQLDRDRAQAVSAHTQECAACRTLLRALERESRLLTRAMLEEDEPLPARLTQFQTLSQPSFQWIWGLIFGLAATGLYALYTSFVEPWMTRLEQAGLGGTSLLSVLISQGAFWKGWQSVITLVEVLAMLVVAGFAAVIFRRRISRRGSALALVLTSMCALLGLPSLASATEFRHQDRVTIGPDEVIHSDLFVASGRVRIEGTIEGDLIAAGGEIEVPGHVTGDILSSSGTLVISGQVDGNVRSYAGNMTIRGKIGHNVLIGGGDLNVDRDAVVTGSVTTFGGHLTVDGQIGRDVLAGGGTVSIAGALGGGLKVRSGELNISSGATVKGPIDFVGDHPPEVASGAKLASPVHFEKMKHGEDDYRNARFYMWRIIWCAAYILFGLVLFNVMPEFSAECVGMAERYGPSLGVGILAIPGVFVGSIIACVTVVGLFIGVSTLFLLWAGVYFGLVVAAAAIGQWLLGRTRESWPLIGRMALGMVIMRVAFAIPAVGGWIKLSAVIWGAGAVALALYSRLQPKIPTIQAATMQPTPVAAPAL
jgi:cytoskeletal protein CcmA (bactofilin family)